MWQELIVGLCVLMAVVFVARQWLPGLKRKKADCGGCSGCGTASSCANPAEKK